MTERAVFWARPVGGDPGGHPGASSARPVGLGWRLAAGALLAVAFLHFGLVGVLMAVPWLLPPTLRSAAEGYQVPMFVQDWRLFAPRPDVHDYAVFARGEYRAGAGLARTPWLTLLDPLVAAVQANRLSPASVRLEVMHKAALLTVREAGPAGQLPTARADLVERWADLERQPASLIVLERLASAALAEVHPGVTFETVQVMVTSRAVVPVGGVNPADGASALLFYPVPFQAVTAR